MKKMLNAFFSRPYVDLPLSFPLFIKAELNDHEGKIVGSKSN